MRRLAKTITISAVIAASAALAVSAAWRPALAVGLYLDGLNTTYDIVGVYPGWPYDTLGNGGCLTCHTIQSPKYGNAPLNSYGSLFGPNHNFAAIEGPDTDGDGASNGFELSLGFYPANPASTPAPPANVQASDAAFADKVRVTWEPLPSGGTIYEIYRSLTNTGLAKIGQSSGSSFDDTGAASGEIYSYAVKACSSHGCTALSIVNTGFTKPSGPIDTSDLPDDWDWDAFADGMRAVAAYANNWPPTGVDASDGTIGQQVKVTWNPRAGAKIYYLYRSTNKNQPLIPPVSDLISETADTEFYDSPPDVGQVYWYCVMACSKKGCSNRSVLDPGWRYTATPTPEMIALSEQGAGERVVAPAALRDPAITAAPVLRPAITVPPERRPAIAVVPVRRPTEDIAPVVRERQPAVIIAPAELMPPTVGAQTVTPVQRVAPAEQAAPAEQESIELQIIDPQRLDRLRIEGAAPERIAR